MAITRRQFVTRLGALATAMGLGQGDISRITEAFAHDSVGFWNTSGFDKPQVIWVHGAECTGCSTSLLSLFENVEAPVLADPNNPLTVAGALTGITGTGKLAGAINATGTHGHRTLNTAGFDFDSVANDDTANIMTIQDVLIDFISLDYHETVMGMGGDLAYQFLEDRSNPLNEGLGLFNPVGAATFGRPFVLVVEGAVQPRPAGEDAVTAAPYCAIGMSDDAAHENEMADMVKLLSKNASAVIAIGQCASFGGYPACKSPSVTDLDHMVEGKQTTASGVYDYLASLTGADAGNEAKVINVPGCPANPWWFILTTVLWMYDVVNGPLKAGATPATTDGPLHIVKADTSLDATALDGGRRLNMVYGSPVHGPACPRYNDYTAGKMALNPGDSGCLELLGCKGKTTNSLCSVHGWNSQQPGLREDAAGNELAWDEDVANTQPYGGFCPAAGHPCMGCTEKGYPDVNVPFVRW